MGGVGIAALMARAFITHVRVKNPPAKMVPCLSLLALSLAIALSTSASGRHSPAACPDASRHRILW